MENDKLKRSEKFWDRMSKNFDKPKKKKDQKLPKTVRYSEKYLNENDTVLDFGCATGKITIDISNYVKQIYGIDLSSKMIEIANKKVHEQNLKNIYFQQSTIFNSKFEDESFNVILGFNILHLIENGPKVLERIHRLLKLDGIFISATPCLHDNNVFLRTVLNFVSKLKVIPYIKSLSFLDLEKLISDGKFEIIQNINISQSIPNHFIVAKKIL